MSDASLVAEERAAVGKGAARKLRERGRIPAVLYGSGKPARSLTVDPLALERLLRGSSTGINTLFELEVGGDTAVVIVKEIQREPVRGRWIHADLYEVDLQKTIEVNVPVHVVGKAPGVELGGILDFPMREVEVECLPRAIPEFVEVDVSALGMGDSVHVRDITLPEGATMLSDPELTVVSVIAPRIEEEAAPAEGEAVLEGAEAAPAAGEAKPEGAAEEGS